MMQSPVTSNASDKNLFPLRAVRGAWVAALSQVAPILAVITVGCSGGTDRVADTVGTLQPIRGQVARARASGGSPVAVTHLARVSVGDVLRVPPGGFARFEGDDGTTLLVGADTTVSLHADRIDVAAGHLYVRAPARVAVHLVSGKRTLRAVDAAFSVERRGDALTVAVMAGELSVDSKVRVKAGEQFAGTVAGDAPGAVAPMVLFDDWTGGFAASGGTPPAEDSLAVLEARVPDEVGKARWPLAVRRLDVRVRLDGPLAVTEVEQTFFNPASETVEGLYRMRLPPGAMLQRFAVDRDGMLVDGYIKEKRQAQQQYEAQVYRGSTLDPALLEWEGPGQYQARIYPIAPGASRRIVLRYAEWVHPAETDGPLLYRFPLAVDAASDGEGATRIQEFSLLAEVHGFGEKVPLRAGLGAEVDSGRVRVRRSDFLPRSDFWLEVDPAEAQRLTAFRATHTPPPRDPQAPAPTGSDKESDYWVFPMMLPADRFPPADAVDLVVVTDISAGTDDTRLELARTFVEALLRHLSPEDRIAVTTADLSLASLPAVGSEPRGAPSLVRAQPEAVRALLDGLARVPSGGATDLGRALSEAAALLDPARTGAVVYVGDGAPTVGEVGAEALLERLLELPRPFRLYAVGVGEEANMELLSALTRGGGQAAQVAEPTSAAPVALQLLAHATRPALLDVTVDTGAGLDHVFPRRAVDLVQGDVLTVTGRVAEAPPKEVVVRGIRAGKPFEETVAVETAQATNADDLRLRWAQERLTELLLLGASREEVADLGVRYGVITPFTSFYVPSAAELASFSPSHGLLDRPRLALREEGDGVRRWQLVPTGLLRGPLALAALGACALGGEAPSREAEPTSAMADGVKDIAQASTAAPPAPPPANTESAPAEEIAEAEPARDAPAEAPADDQAENAPAPLGGVSGELDGEAFGYGGLGLAGTGRGGGGEGGARGASTTARPMSPQSVPEPARSRAATEALVLGRRQGQPELEADEPARSEASTGRDLSGSFALGDLQDRASRANKSGASGIFAGVWVTHGGGSRCSDAARTRLAARRALWRERLARRREVAGYWDEYARAERQCELSGWRDRRVLLSLLLDRARTMDAMLSLAKCAPSTVPDAWLREAIFKRVRTPEELSKVRRVFGVDAAEDMALVEQLLAKTANVTQRIAVLRLLRREAHQGFGVDLRLLAELEQAKRLPEAKRLAHTLRLNPLVDSQVRTHIGEMFLRLGDEGEARRAFSEIVEFAPVDELARRRLGDLYRAHGWFDDAYRQYTTLTRIRPDDRSVNLLLAQAAAGAGRIEEALQLEQTLLDASSPGGVSGLARVAMYWSSVRYAKLFQERQADGDGVDALRRRRRRSAVGRNSVPLRVALTWSHPDASIGLWGAYPGLSMTRPRELYPTFGIEVIDVTELEDGTYRFEVRRVLEAPVGLTTRPGAPGNGSQPSKVPLQAIEAELVLLWDEGKESETVQVIPLRFEGDRTTFAWTLVGRTVAPASPESAHRPLISRAAAPVGGGR